MLNNNFFLNNNLPLNTPPMTPDLNQALPQNSILNEVYRTGFSPFTGQNVEFANDFNVISFAVRRTVIQPGSSNIKIVKQDVVNLDNPYHPINGAELTEE
jgi:hypothetical protein